MSNIKFRDAELAKGWGQIVPTLAVETTGKEIEKMNSYGNKIS